MDSNVERIVADHVARKAVPHIEDAPPLPADQSPPKGPAEQSTGPLLDSKGIPYDPALHDVKKDGTPAKTKGGVWKKRKAVQTTLLEDQPQAANTPAQRIDPVAGAHTAALETCSMVEIAFIAIMGPEAALDASERETYVATWEKFYLAYGIVNIPPWIAVIAVTAMLCFTRFQMPACRARIDKIVNKFKEVKARKEAAKRGDYAHHDSGNDRLRQDNASPTNGDGVTRTQ